jgi:hypothetical protein
MHGAYNIKRLLLLLFPATEFLFGGSSPYTSPDKTHNNKYTWTKQYKTQQIQV